MVFNKVLTATDGSRRAEYAAGVAIQVALDSGGELFIISVADTSSPRTAMDLDADSEKELLEARPTPDVEQIREQRTAHEERFAKNVKLAALGEGLVTHTAVSVGNPAEEILGFAEEKGCDLIVVGSHRRRPLTTAIMGSVATSLIHSGMIPVLVIPAQENG